MSSEIIQNVGYDNYDDFQHVNFIFLHKFLFHYFEDYLVMKLTLGQGIDGKVAIQGGFLKMITNLYCGFREKLNIDIQIMDESKS
jgi:hypothetical protein